jgi:DNA mismatch repair protein MLH3
MIANDNLIKLMITDTATDRKLIIRPQTRRRRTDDGLDLQRIGSILAQAALIDYQNADSWDVAYASVPDFAIHAAISLVPSPTKKVQFVSVGMDPIFPRSSVNLFYSEVNRLFSLSDFGTMGAPSVAALDASSGEHLDHQSSTNTKPMTKSVNKWPMFYIRIDTNEPYKVNGESQGVPESDKSVQRILDVLTAMVFEFLRQHKLRPRARKRRQKMPRNVTIGENTSNASSALSHLEEASSTEEALGGRLKLPNFQKSAPRTCQSFGEWSKIKVAKESFNAHSRKPETKLLGLENASGIEQPLAQDNQPAKRRTPVESRWSLANNGSTDNYDDPERDPMVPWTDPYTGRSHLVNSRTGQSIDVRSPMDAFRRSKSTGSLQSIRTSDSATRSRSTILSRTQNLWVEKLLGSWENPAFSRTEKPVNVIGARCDIGTDTMHARVHDGSAELCGFDNLGLSKFRGKLRKQDLEAAEVVAQVDQKFILAKLKFTAMNCHSSDPNSTLVLIDQHAGDERCRVERLLEEFFTPPVGGPRQVQTVTLEPLIFEIPVTEASLFGRYTKFFKFWGVDYTVEQEPANTTTHISVNKLPTLIAERCRLEPELVTNLIRGEIWKREENGRGSRPSFLGLEGGAGRWADRLDSCPQGIIELLNSRACRTSIMFNDKLTIDECQSLVRQLARCVFPFQCAHGRPSMIPILDMTQNVALVQLEAEYTREEGEHLEFTEAFRAWRDRIAFH